MPTTRPYTCLMCGDEMLRNLKIADVHVVKYGDQHSSAERAVTEGHQKSFEHQQAHCQAERAAEAEKVGS